MRSGLAAVVVGLVAVLTLAAPLGCRPSPQSQEGNPQGGSAALAPPALHLESGQPLDLQALGWSWRGRGQAAPQAVSLADPQLRAPVGQPMQAFADCEPPSKVELTVFNLDAFRSKGTSAQRVGRFEVNSGDIEPAPSGATWSWVVPENIGPDRVWGNPEALYALWVRVEWSGDWAVYCCSLEVIPTPDATGALDATRAFFDASWKGDQSGAEAILDIDPIYEEEGRFSTGCSLCSLLEVWVTSPWDDILWRFGPTLSLPSSPAFELASMSYLSGLDFFMAEVAATYYVEAREAGAGSAVRYRFNDIYHLDQTPAGWRVTWFARRGIPCLADAGASAGWETALTVDRGRLKCGPFSSVGSPRWEPGGARLAFVGVNFERREVWVVDPASGEGTRSFVLPLTFNSMRDPEQQCFLPGWSRDGRLVVFVAGDLTVGPHKGQSGWWVALAPAAGGPAETVTFVPTEFPGLWEGPRLTADREALIVYDSPYQDESAFYRIDLDGGQMTRVLEGVRGLPVLSPDGGTLADGPEGPPEAGQHEFELTDLDTGKTATLGPPADPPADWCRLGRWLSDDIVTVEYAWFEDTWEDFESGLRLPSNLAGVVLYDTQGTERGRFLPRSKDGRLEAYGSSPDGKRLVFVEGLELWLWEMDSDRCHKLTQDKVSGTVVRWPSDSLVRVGSPDDQGRNARWRDFELICEDGLWTAIERKWPGGAADHLYGETGGVVFLGREGWGEERILAEQGGTETLVCQCPEFWALGVDRGYLVGSERCCQRGLRQFLWVIPAGAPGL